MIKSSCIDIFIVKNTISLKPQDTMCLIPGLYYYQLKLRTADEEVFTLIPKTAFYILE